MPTTQQLARDYAKAATPEFQRIVSQLVLAIENAPVKLDAAIKWRQLTFANQNDFHHWVCAINLTKGSVNLLFHYGSLLTDPKGLLQAGSGKFVRKLAYRSEAEVNLADIESLVAEALAKYRYFRDNWKRIQAEA